MAEETKNELRNWIYYNNEPKADNCNELNTFNDETGQQLLYIDSTTLIVNDNEQSFQYDSDDLICNEAEDQDLQNNDQQIVNPSEEMFNDDDDASQHILILREAINESGQMVEEYFCQLCKVPFNSIEDFLHYHPNIELLDNNLDQEIDSKVSEGRLWDLVENVDEVQNEAEDIIEKKPNISPTEENDGSLDHNNVELDDERYFCCICQQVFTNIIAAENHGCIDQLQYSEEFTETESTLFVDNADDNVYRCDLCDKEYSSLRSFTNHQRWHTKSQSLVGYNKTLLHEEPAICDICNTIFASEKNLKLHMKMHKKQAVKTIQEALPVGAQEEYNELNKFFCEICNKSFDQKLLVIHKNMHQNLKEYTCGKCNKQFDNLSNYEIHLQMHVDNEAKGKKINNSKKLIEINNFEKESAAYAQGTRGAGKKKHACQYCGKEFLRPYEKVKHERIHTGEKPYECEVCGKTFRVSYSLTLHLRTHTDIRPYVCATCNKRFKQQSVYVHHLKTHEIERAYKCEVCGKTFRTSVQLSGHKNIHSKPYNCPDCSRPFSSLYAVKIHMKTHNKCYKSNKNAKNSCNICGASYTRVFALRYHMKEQHDIDIELKEMFTNSNADTNTNTENEIDAETELLMNVANEASNQQFDSINTGDLEYNEKDNDNIFTSQIDHEENIQNTLPNNIYLSETETATQTILNTEEIIVDHLPAEEIITDWLSK